MACCVRPLNSDWCDDPQCVDSMLIAGELSAQEHSFARAIFMLVCYESLRVCTQPLRRISNGTKSATSAAAKAQSSRGCMCAGYTWPSDCSALDNAVHLGTRHLAASRRRRSMLFEDPRCHVYTAS